MGYMKATFELGSSAYEVSTVVMDIVLNAEYIKRKWIEEYILSIAFLVFSGVVMGMVGLALESRRPNRYVAHNDFLNKTIAFLIGLLQLRVLVETFMVVSATFRAEKRGDNPSGPESSNTSNSNATHGQPKDKEVQRLSDGLSYASFIQAMVRDIPIFVIQANATIHYRKWLLVDLWAVFSTFLTLLHAASSYVTKGNTGALKYAAGFFMFGQFVFRLGAILLVAMTTGLTIVYYSFVIIFCSLVWTIKLHLAHPTPTASAQFSRALLFFPFFTIFVVNGSQLTARYGDAVDVLADRKLRGVHAWRIIENCFGIALAMTQERYRDFGVSTSEQVMIIGAICAIVFAVSWIVFALVYRSYLLHKSEENQIPAPASAGPFADAENAYLTSANSYSAQL